MKEIKVVAYDDIHAAEGRKVEAEWIDVEVQFGEEGVVADLTDEHYQVVREALASVLAVGKKRQKPEAVESGELDGGRKRANPVSPLDKLCPFAVGTPERRDYLIGIRFWADQEGRAEEYQSPQGTAKRDENQYHYPKQLLLDYNQFLGDQARRKAS